MGPGDKDLMRGSSRGRERFSTLFVVVVMIALPLRLFVAERAELISRDGAVFIWYAQELQRDALAEMRNQKQHPLYPAMILVSHHVLASIQRVIPALPTDPVRSWVAAAVAVALLGGLLVIVGVYAIARLLFGERVAMIAALLAAVTAEFCQLSGDALTDMPHLGVYLLGIAAAIRGVRDRSLLWLAAAGALSGMAYLIRPEGAEVAVVAVAGILFAGGALSFRHRLVGAVVVCLAAAAIASPYMAVTGKLVPKKSLMRMFWGPASETISERIPSIERTDTHESDTLHRLMDAGRSSRPERDKLLAGGSVDRLVLLGKALAKIAENWARSLRVMLLLPALLWLVVRRRRPCEATGARLTSIAIVLHLVIAAFLIVNFDYLKLFSLRHVMLLAGLTLPFSAAGVAIVLDTAPAGRQRLVMLVLAASLIGPTLPWMLETRHAEAVHIRRAGEWIREQARGTPRVMTTRHRAAFYANGLHVWCPPDLDAGWVLAEARTWRPGWLVFEEREQSREVDAFFDGLRKSLAPGEHLERVRTTTGDGPAARQAAIFRYSPPP